MSRPVLSCFVGLLDRHFRGECSGVYPLCLCSERYIIQDSRVRPYCRDLAQFSVPAVVNIGLSSLPLNPWLHPARTQLRISLFFVPSQHRQCKLCSTPKKSLTPISCAGFGRVTTRRRCVFVVVVVVVSWRVAGARDQQSIDSWKKLIDRDIRKKYGLSQVYVCGVDGFVCMYVRM